MNPAPSTRTAAGWRAGRCQGRRTANDGRARQRAAANLSIAVATVIGALISGSAAMLSEAAHSVADTVTEVLLFVALRRGNRPPDARHPLGYRRESYHWALLAALATFMTGAVVSVLEGPSAA